MVVEATANYYWFVELVEPWRRRWCWPIPSKLRVIAESTKKTDRLDAQVLAEFLALDMIPKSYMPTPRQRQHRALVRHRQYLRGRMTSVKCKIRHILADYNADRRTCSRRNAAGCTSRGSSSTRCDRFVFSRPVVGVQDLDPEAAEEDGHEDQGVRGQGAAEGSRRRGGLLKTAPGIGVVTAEVVLSELGDVSRFKNAKAVCAYAGLVPVVRQTGGKKAKDGRITKEGPGLLRWALVESSWRLVASSAQWSNCVRTDQEAQRREACGGGGGAEAAVRAVRDAPRRDGVQGRRGLTVNE